MNTFVVFATVLAAACAAPSVTIQKIGYGPSTLVRAPAHDSASIESHRYGDNFAYATAEAHAYASVTPEISEATHPVAETTYTHHQAKVAHVKPAPIVKTHHAARPVFGQQPVYGQEAVIGPVRQHTVVQQPIYKQQHVTVQQPHVQVNQHVVAAPAAIEYAAAPAAVEYAAAPVAVGAVGYAAPAAVKAAVGYTADAVVANAGLVAAAPLNYKAQAIVA